MATTSDSTTISTAAQKRANWDPNKGVFGFVKKAGDELNEGAEYLKDRSAYAYAKSYEKFIGKVGEAIGKVAGEIDKLTGEIDEAFDNISKSIKKAFEPISDFMGSTLGTLTGVEKDPAGTQGLGNIATNVLNNISPGYGDKVNQTVTNLNLQAIANFPKQLFSSVDKLITSIDNILAIPLSLLAEIYYGYMEIMKSINKLLSKLMDGFSELLLDFLDSIVPINDLLGLLEQVSSLANQIGGIASTFAASNTITNFTNQITNFSSQIGSIINNPIDVAVTYLPSQVDDILNTIQNPQQAINDLLPDELSQAFSKISSMTGFGFNGNMGYGFQSVLQGLQGGVLRSILTNYSAQYNILTPLLAGTGNANTTAGTSSTSNKVETNNGYSQGSLNKEGTRGTYEKQYESETDDTEKYSSDEDWTDNPTTSNNSDLRVQVDSDSGEAWIVDASGQIVRSANATEEATGVVQ